jgi:hypothetical protein
MTYRQQIEKLKSEGKYYEAGELAAATGYDRDYGCHYGMKSRRAFAISEFHAGWDQAAYEIEKSDALCEALRDVTNSNFYDKTYSDY